MDLRVLGPLEVENGLTPVVLGGPKQRALLARLALDAGQTVSTDRLIDDLWGEDVPGTAAKMVQIYVSQLRKALPDRVIVTRPPGYALEIEADALDLARFKALRERGRAALARGEAAEAASLLREALGLWRGPALAEFAEPFAVAEAARLEDERLTSLEDRIEADLACARHPDVVPELEALVAREPLRERPREQLMVALYRSGRQADALESYRRYRAMLDEELGIAPTARLQELHTKLLRQDPVLEPPGVAAVPPASPARRRPRRGPDPEPGVRFATAPDGVRLAYLVEGEGPPLVRVATWLTHIDHDRGSPVWQHWLTALGRGRTLVRYDERGCGLSDPDIRSPSLDRWVDDLGTVVDAAGLERFDLIGISQGGAIALAYAARNRERVDRIVLYGAYPRGRLHRDDTDQVEEARALADIIRRGWGSKSPAYRRVFTTLFLPDGTPEQMDWYDELQRVSTDGETAARLREARDDLDVTRLVAQVRSPCLVLHASDDRLVPLGEGELLARLVPDARFVPLPSRNHILLADEPAWTTLEHELDEFLAR